MARFAHLALLAVGLLPGIALAGKPFVPSWIKNDPAAKRVAIEIVADWNQVERYRRDNIRTDIIDFNGYWGGNLTIIVLGERSVQIEFINGSSNFRHGLMVTRVYARSEMPVKLKAEDAIWGAYTAPLEGIKINERRQLNFVAQQAANYFLACPRQTHLMDGDWIGFEVRGNLERAMAIVHEDKSAGAAPRTSIGLREQTSAMVSSWRSLQIHRALP
ncbi:hypothetical protein NKJ72_19935 [Mesorhizobium sp. M0045]|uniref:hypothetical protein n=1 Tax=Mesorhizobium sp. M0045 TaxID=2956857 RepID=UPI0033372D60